MNKLIIQTNDHSPLGELKFNHKGLALYNTTKDYYIHTIIATPNPTFKIDVSNLEHTKYFST
jgi:hypothetical protein